MTQTRVAVLTPPGSSAIAVIELHGPEAWNVVRRFFRTKSGKELNSPPLGMRHGRFGDVIADEVVLVGRATDTFEVQCHGGRQVINMMLELFRSAGVEEVPWQDSKAIGRFSGHAAKLLPFAKTLRTASILLDQVHGAHERFTDQDRLRQILQRNAAVGRHLVEPWKVAIAGAPNAGKSSLMNALAGFARSIVSPIPGTTRDAVSVSLAFDGWAVTLFDTAGMRDARDDIEREGISRAKHTLAESDLILWVVDATTRRPATVQDVHELAGMSRDKIVVVFNKIDLVEVPPTVFPDAVRVSAKNNVGIDELAQRIASTLVPHPPMPGEPVPVA